jgi:hypothetical protein
VSQSMAGEVSTDVDGLAAIIRMPIRPVSVVWRRQVLGSAGSQVPGPTDWELEALLTFDQNDAERLADEARHSEKPRDIGSIDGIEWLPSEARSDFEAVPKSSRYRAKGESYVATSFAKPPLSQGHLTRLGESPRFFLKLYTQ